MDRSRRIYLPLVLALLGACSDGTGPADEATRVVIGAPGSTLGALGDTLHLDVEVLDGDGNPLPGARVAWSSLDQPVATVDSLGRVVARAAGSARIVASSGPAADTLQVTVAVEEAESQLRFVALSAAAPPLATLDTSFWAVRGDDRELRIRFETGGDDEDVLRFRVRDRSLLSYPDGRAFAEGDSVLIRVQADPSGLFLFRFEPSGLRFDPDEPAELRVRYHYATEADLAREDSFFLWRQERPGDPWERIATARVHDLDEVRADVTGFTAFALAIP